MTNPSPSALIDSARTQPIHSAARTNLLLEAIALSLAERKPATRPRATPTKPSPEASTPPHA